MIAHHTTAPTVDLGWVDALALAGRLRLGEPLPSLELEAVPAGERVSLDTGARLDQWRAGAPEPVWGDESAQVVVTDRRILVSHDWHGETSLWHVDLENLQLGLTDQEWHLDLHPVGINPRVRLLGDAAPLIAVHVAATVFPGTWARLSGLLPLLDAAA